MLPVVKEYLEKQEDIGPYINEYGNVKKEMPVVNRVVSNRQGAMIQTAQRVRGMDSQGTAEQ